MTSTPLHTWINVVQIGFGLSGASSASAISDALPATHRLIVISATESAYYSVGALRGAVVPGWEEKITLPIENFFPNGSRHIVLVGTKVVELGKNHVVIDKLHPELGFSSPKVEFEYGILAMGSSYAFPARPPTSSSSESHIHSVLASLQTSISTATSVLIVGAGPVGIELAGEIAYSHPGKKVTLVCSGDALMSDGGFKKSLGDSLRSQLEAAGVECIFGQRLDTGDLETGAIEKRSFDLGKGKSVEADFLFKSYGSTPNTSLIVSLSPTLLDSHKRVLIKPTFQLDSPSTSDKSYETEVKGQAGEFDHLFAIGDICNVDETKLWAHGQHHGTVVAANIALLISASQSGKSATLKKYTPGAKLIVVSVGPNGGAGQIYFGVVIGAWATAMAKSRGLFLDKFRSSYRAK